MARNCSSRSMSGTEVGLVGVGGRPCWDVGCAGGRCDVGCGGGEVSNGVRASEGGMTGKAEVEKTKRSRGTREEEYIMREVWPTVPY